MNYFLTLTYLFVFTLTSCKSKKDVASENKPAATKETVSVSEGLNLGNKAPEIALKNPNDSLIALSSLKGKMVLVDFWASWCGPCRHENPIVVNAYKKYSDKKLNGSKGFAIFSVSLDVDRNAWKKAIVNDQLSWPYHVSDLKAWGSEVVTKYDIKGIPTNVLIDEKGVIVAKNLRGDDLEKTLEKYVLKQ